MAECFCQECHAYYSRPVGYTNPALCPKCHNNLELGKLVRERLNNYSDVWLRVWNDKEGKYKVCLNLSYVEYWDVESYGDTLEEALRKGGIKHD